MLPKVIFVLTESTSFEANEWMLTVEYDDMLFISNLPKYQRRNIPEEKLKED